MIRISRSEEETRGLGRKFGEEMHPGLLVLLCGDLGTGKTVFVRGVGEALGISGVRSPSFTLINEYESDSGLRVIHADLYRLDDSGSRGLGLDEYIDAGDSVVFVEWPERMSSLTGREVITITFEALSESERRIEFTAQGLKSQEVIERL